MSIAVTEALHRHADVCDELSRLSVCARCVVRLVCGEVAHHEHTNTELNAVLTAAISQSNHSTAFFSPPLDSTSTAPTTCPLCFGCLQYFFEPSSATSQCFGAQAVSALQSSSYSNVRASDIQLSVPSHFRIRSLAAIAHLRSISNLRKRQQQQHASSLVQPSSDPSVDSPMNEPLPVVAAESDKVLSALSFIPSPTGHTSIKDSLKSMLAQYINARTAFNVISNASDVNSGVAGLKLTNENAAVDALRNALSAEPTPFLRISITVSDDAVVAKAAYEQLSIAQQLENNIIRQEKDERCADNPNRKKPKVRVDDPIADGSSVPVQRCLDALCQKDHLYRLLGMSSFPSVNLNTLVTYNAAEHAFAARFPCPTSVAEPQISCLHDSIFFAGLYLKWDRELSQTPFLINDKRINGCDDSVEELIARPLFPLFQTSGSKFHSSGREDMDVRMLGCFASTGQLELFTPSDCIEQRLVSLSSGLGRQFVIELVDPHCPFPSIESTSSAEAALPSLCQRLINENSNSTDRVCVHALTPCTRQFFEILKHGETHKVKEYQCVCWSSAPVTVDTLTQLQQRCHDLVITQKTPLRVSHRRTLMDRKRVIHDIHAELLHTVRLGSASSQQSHFFTLTLSTQAGTYIKEFVHGDKGRTRPSVADLLELNGSADILQLDVVRLLPQRKMAAEIEAELRACNGDEDDE